MSTKPKLLVLCTANSARSQMGEGLFRAELGDQYDVYSAGTRATYVRPEAIRALAEIGIDISGHTSKTIDDLGRIEFDVVVTVCDNARDNCPVLPGVPKAVHWSLPDPAGLDDPDERMAAFRAVRDDLRERIRAFAGGLA